MERSASTLAALALAAAAVSATAGATDREMHSRECIYDYVMITERECRAFRAKILDAKTPQARAKVHEDLDRLRFERARARGIPPDDWRGLSVPPLAERR